MKAAIFYSQNDPSSEHQFIYFTGQKKGLWLRAVVVEATPDEALSLAKPRQGENCLECRRFGRARSYLMIAA
jgi:hypothetical protein